MSNHGFNDRPKRISVTNVILATMVVVLTFFAAFDRFKSPVTIQKVIRVYTITPIEKMQPTLENAYFWIKFWNVRNPDMALQQLRLESGNMTSHIFLRDRNCFGMNYPTKRKTTAIARDGRWAVYSDFVSSILDYKYYQDAIGVPDGLSDYQYYKFLEDHHYWQDSTYLQKLLR
jgi:hypothetical protein